MDLKSKMVRLTDLSPRCLLRALVREIGLIAACAAIFAMGASLYLSWFHAPVYQASMTYAVTAREGSIAISNNVSASKEVTAVMTELLKEEVITEKLGAANEKLVNFSGTIAATQVGETNLIAVTARAGTPEQAFLALDTLVDVFPELSNYLSENSVAQVIRRPSVSAYPVNAVNVRSQMVRWGLLGGAAMAALILWLSIARETVQTREGARRMLDAPILVSVGHERKNRTLRAALKRANRSLQVFAPTTSADYTEQINTICTRLEQENASRGLRVFLVTGVGENEGKSTIAANTAAMLAMKGRKVALIDGDMRKPAMKKFFDGAYQSDLPLNAMLAKPFSLEHLKRCMVRHKKIGLYMLFGIGAERQSMKLLTCETMRQSIRAMEQFEFIIIDTPPMGMFPDAEAAANLADASLLVVRQDYTPACDINDAVDVLKKAKARFLGCVLNDMDSGPLTGYGYGHGYGYGYGYGRKKK